MAPLNFIATLALLASVPIASAQSCWRDTECTGPLEPAFPGGPWEDNNFSPFSRTVQPATVFALDSPNDAQDYPSLSNLQGNASALVFDFGKEVGGWITVNFSTSGGAGKLGLAFSEAKNWIGLASDSSNGAFARGTGDQACDDGALHSPFDGEGKYSYVMPDDKLRGGFRYMTLFLFTSDEDTSIDIGDIELEIGFEPTWSNLRAYQGYFHSNDEGLNKIWYSGAYTLQTNAVPPATGRWIPPLESSWANNGTMSNGSTVIVDGAKRDRAVWPGDMGIAVPSSFVSTGGLEAVVNALQAMYDYQNPDGSFPEAGPPLLQQGSDTYHCWTMIGTYNYILYTNDMAWLDGVWKRYQEAMEYIYGKVMTEGAGLLNVTGTRDWARQAQGGNNTEANVILFHTLRTGARLAEWKNDTSLMATYTARAETLRAAIISQTYDEASGAFRDNNTNTTLHPQDANSLAIMFDLLPGNSSEAASVSSVLTQNWTPIGAEAPELPNNISPFISSFEIQAHFRAGQPDRALELIRRSWGWYLNNENGTGSTVIEGYLTNGSFGYRNYQGYMYDSAYVSHAHGWSAGPTYALTTYVLGLEVTEREGKEWRLAPMFGDLTSVEGGFATGLGKFSASWNVTEGGMGYEMEWAAPVGTKGEVVMPALPGGREGRVVMGGEEMGRPGIRMSVVGKGSEDVQSVTVKTA